jgi:hypothetical protein
VIVQPWVRSRQPRFSLSRLPHRAGQPLRYRHVLYESQEAEAVEVIVYCEKGFQDAYFLPAPPDSQVPLPTPDVVASYRPRTQVEQVFANQRSHLGLRALHLWMQKPKRRLRILMGFT